MHIVIFIYIDCLILNYTSSSSAKLFPASPPTVNARCPRKQVSYVIIAVTFSTADQLS